MKNVLPIDFLKDLSDEQKKACQSEGNTILTACPGSGKTRTVTYRLAYLQSRYDKSRRIHVAITYTHRAADEIQNRLDVLDVDMSKIWVGTIHQFCLTFIIRPYAMYSERLRSGYTLIDEYIKNRYLSEIQKNLGIKVERYKNPLEDKRIRDDYEKHLQERREIDFDDILKISSELLENNTFICENIASQLFSVQIDEYQDTNEKQYAILKLISKADRSIWFSFVGDPNQAIYGGLGGVAKSSKEISSMFNLDFQEYFLSDCYRSSKLIIEFYKKFAIDPVPINSKKSESGNIYFNEKVNKTELAKLIASTISKIIERGIPENEICIVAPVWHMLFPLISELKKLMPNVKFDSPEISPFKYDPLNPFYLIAKLAFTISGKGSKARRKVAQEVIGILTSDFGIELPRSYDYFSLLKAVNEVECNLEQDGFEYFERVMASVMLSMRIDLKTEERLDGHYSDFRENSKQRIKSHSLSTSYDEMCRSFNERTGVVVNTIHGVKGEEYNTVIAFGLLHGYVPNWSDIIRKSDCGRSASMKLLYVLCSRAKENLYLISESGRTTNSNNPYESNKELIAAVKMSDDCIIPEG